MGLNLVSGRTRVASERLRTGTQISRAGRGRDRIEPPPLPVRLSLIVAVAGVGAIPEEALRQEVAVGLRALLPREIRRAAVPEDLDQDRIHRRIGDRLLLARGLVTVDAQPTASSLNSNALLIATAVTRSLKESVGAFTLSFLR